MIRSMNVAGRAMNVAGWTTGLLAAASAVTHDDHDPVILVMEAGSRISAIVTDLCEFMNIRLVRATDESALRRHLWVRRPIGVICNLQEIVASPDCAVLKLVSDYDRTLPLMLVSDAHPRTLGLIDAVEDLCRMSNVTRLTTVPAAFEIVEFILDATRRRGRALPI